jgi:carboxymethylenebutenolidase
VVALSIAQFSLAQQSCCSANETFVNNSKDPGFNAAHDLRTSDKKSKLKGSMIKIHTPDSDSANAYLVPANNPSNKWVFVFHEWWGLNEHIQNEADELFKELGDVNVLCLDLYDGLVATNREEASSLMQSAEEYRIRQIIRRAIDLAGYEADISTIGWCFGGTWAMQAAIMLGRQGKACVIYYGMPELNRASLLPLKANVMGIFAEDDKWINKEIVSQFSDLMDVLQKNLDLVVFPADHAFANPSGSNFNQQFAKEAKKISTAFLIQNFE